MYKNPKKPTERGVSSMQPSSSQSTKKSSRDRGVIVGNAATLEGVVNEEQFRKRKIGSIPADQVCNRALEAANITKGFLRFSSTSSF